MDSDARHIARPAPAFTSPPAATGTPRALAFRRPPAVASTACGAYFAPVPAAITTTEYQAHPLTAHGVAPDTGTDQERR